MDARQIRNSYLTYLEERGHTVIERAPLVPKGDTSTLFNGSGMQSLLPYLLGQEHPAGVRLTDSQPCVRAQDIDEVGDNRHTTFFEMLGNWSLGDYFKETQIRQFYSFLVDVVGLDPSRIYVTCFIGDPANGIPRDDEAASIWAAVFAERGVSNGVAEIGSQADGDARGVKPGERIFFYDGGENWWSRGGSLEGTPIGDPCGPDSEVFYDFGAEHQDASYGLAHPASDGGQFMEIGNQVFMQYRRREDGSFEELTKRNVDFGGGLERIAAASIGSDDVFRISLLWPIIESLQALTGRRYEDETAAMRIIADHLRGATFLAVDGVRPSNKEQGYVMRRLLRRAIRFALSLGLSENFFSTVVPVIADLYAADYPEVAASRDEVIAVLVKEETAFRRTLTSGLRALAEYQGSTLTGLDVFRLSDTHGFPKELSIEEARRLGIDVVEDWESGFAAALEEQRARSRGATRLGAAGLPGGSAPA
ncbi:alanine--tRNA ligase-related protein [Agreia sp. VKM Ac-1783]|uniref:alanine--tRNA ligase-related protein n=1 Tax=Agreia sp. VKM Ac-1783 TaxID=1938889 RepID=UPI000A2ACF0E|nr:alanine--tRNA ligase-related protein [Agreia sp. VKM Ac-1783]SMQ68395.1 alanyl-tRNA synthetase [Agreia sp. VKM Ac-1783]